MQKQNRQILVLINMICEVGIILLAYPLSVFIRFTVMGGVFNSAMTTALSMRLIVTYSVATVCVYWMAHLYVPIYYITIRTELLRVFIINLTGTVILGSALYLFRITEFSRVALALYFAVSTTLIFGKRILVHLAVRKHRILGDRRRHVILVGSGKLARQYTKDVANNPHLGLVIDGYVGFKGNNAIGRHLGKIDKIGNVLEKYSPDQVIVALEPDETGFIKAVLEAVEKEEISVSMVPFYSEFLPQPSNI